MEEYFKKDIRSEKLLKLAQSGELDRLMDIITDESFETEDVHLLYCWLSIAENYGSEEAGEIIETLTDSNQLYDEDIAYLNFELGCWYILGINISTDKKKACEYFDYCNKLMVREMFDIEDIIEWVRNELDESNEEFFNRYFPERKSE